MKSYRTVNILRSLALSLCFYSSSMFAHPIENVDSEVVVTRSEVKRISFLRECAEPERITKLDTEQGLAFYDINGKVYLSTLSHSKEREIWHVGKDAIKILKVPMTPEFRMLSMSESTHYYDNQYYYLRRDDFHPTELARYDSITNQMFDIDGPENSEIGQIYESTFHDGTLYFSAKHRSLSGFGFDLWSYNPKSNEFAFHNISSSVINAIAPSNFTMIGESLYFKVSTENDKGMLVKFDTTNSNWEIIQTLSAKLKHQTKDFQGLSFGIGSLHSRHNSLYFIDSTIDDDGYWSRHLLALTHGETTPQDLTPTTHVSQANVHNIMLSNSESLFWNVDRPFGLIQQYIFSTGEIVEFDLSSVGLHALNSWGMVDEYIIMLTFDYFPESDTAYKNSPDVLVLNTRNGNVQEFDLGPRSWEHSSDFVRILGENVLIGAEVVNANGNNERGVWRLSLDC